MADEVAPSTAEVVEVKPDDHYAARKAKGAAYVAPEPAAEVASEDVKPAETAPAETAETKETAAETGETEDKTEPQAEDAAAAKARKRRTLEEENYRLRQKNRELREMAETRGANGDGRQAETQKPPEPAKRPKQEDFQDYEAYQEALIDWKADAKLQDFQARQMRAQSEGQAQREAQTKAQRFVESAEKVRSKPEHDDFDEVVFDPELKITQVMRAVIEETDEPAELAYYLGKNPDVAKRIANMSPAKAAMELGRIEDRLKPSNATTPKPVTTTPKRETNAPPPPKVVTGGSARASTDLKTLNQDDYYAQRTANRKQGVR